MFIQISDSVKHVDVKNLIAQSKNAFLPNVAFLTCVLCTPFRRPPAVMPPPTWRVRTLLEDTAVFVEWDTLEYLKPHRALKVAFVEMFIK